MRNIRLEDVARKAGVSMKTVSRVVNGEPNVRANTQEKVLEAIKLMNYRPNASARSLAGNRSYLVGLLYGDVSPAYLFEVQNGALKAGNETHYGLVLHPCETVEDDVSGDVADFLKQSRVDGLILTPPISDNMALIRLLDAEKIPYVRLSPMDSDMGMTVSIDEKQAAAEMMKHLLDLGHRRIGFIKGPMAHGASRWRYESYKASLEKTGIIFNPALVADGDFSFDSGKIAAEKLLSGGNPPTAIFASNDNMAAGVIHTAFERGLQIPRDISIAGFDDAPLARQLWPSLTTIHQPMRGMGHMAMAQLLTMIRGDDCAGPEQSILNYELIIRASTANVGRGQSHPHP
ncbi:MAG: LacI family transcriptional regulator [Alphaproteobacteria bacterium]|nr:MAG: LacI family transcriptional regulator [Alphaproteobacteria bacterium]